MVSAIALVLYVSGGAALCWTAWHVRTYWGEPGARTFSALTAAMGVAALFQAAAAVDRNVALVSGALLWMLGPVLWALFVFDFTGRFDVRSRRRRFLLLAPAVYMIAANLALQTLAYVELGQPLWRYEWNTSALLAESMGGSLGTVVSVVGTGQVIGYVFTSSLLALAGAVCVLQTRKYDHLGTGVGAALTGAAVGPWFVQYVAWSFAGGSGFESATVHVPVALSLFASGVVFPTVVERCDLFDTTPVAGTVGPARVFEDMSEPVFVVDHDERIIRANPAARRAFDPESGIAGTDLSDLVGYDVDALAEAEILDVSDGGGQRSVDPSVSVMESRGERALGYAVVLRDVTGKEVRQQRLEVLNRVLRHNLRNDVTTIRGRAELLADGSGETSEIGDVITDSAEDLVSLSERAREIEQMLSVKPTTADATGLRRLVSEVVADVPATADATVDVSVPEDLVVGVDERVLAPVLRNLVENAVVHSDQSEPWVRISAAAGEGSLPVQIVVQDDGPGLPANERAAVESGEENPLEHASGLGLWAVKWGVTRMGGRLSFADNQPRGTVVEISLPGAQGSSEASGDGADAPTSAD